MSRLREQYRPGNGGGSSRGVPDAPGRPKRRARPGLWLFIWGQVICAAAFVYLMVMFVFYMQALLAGAGPVEALRGIWEGHRAGILIALLAAGLGHIPVLWGLVKLAGDRGSPPGPRARVPPRL